MDAAGRGGGGRNRETEVKEEKAEVEEVVSSCCRRQRGCTGESGEKRDGIRQFCEGENVWIIFKVLKVGSTTKSQA